MYETEYDNIKTLKEWEAAEIPWNEYAKPGDLVEKKIYDRFINAIKPETYKSGYLQVGEAYSRCLNRDTGKMAYTFMTFEKVEDGLYRYCGTCFKNETEHIE